MSHITALACPMMRDEIDTDALIPVAEYTKLSASGFGPALFASWRYAGVGARLPNPDFILNQPPFDRAQILIAGRNFGCGSSRESAVWALRDYGFRVVVAISFNETFQRNCIANKIWPLLLDDKDIVALAESIMNSPERPLRVDLSTCILSAEKPFRFRIDPYYRRLLSEGLTEDELLARFRTQILATRSI